MNILNFSIININMPLKNKKAQAIGIISNPFAINFTGTHENSDRVELSEKAQFIRSLEMSTDFPSYEIRVQLEGEKRPSMLKKYSGSQFGTNPAFWALNQANNKLYYIKYAKNSYKKEHIQREIEASKLYNLAGIKTPNVQACKIYGEVDGLASEYVSGMQEITNPKDVHIGFAADAWLANWDSLIDGNTMVVNGEPLKLDNGGALNYRALGELKPNFGNTVEELITLVDGTNPVSQDIYSKISHKTLVQSFNRVCSITDKEIKDVVKDKTIAQTLINRRNYMSIVLQNIIDTPYNGKNLPKYMKSVTQNIDFNSFEPYKFHEEIFDSYIAEIPLKGGIAPSTRKTHKILLNLIKEKEKQGIHISREQLIEFFEGEAEKKNFIEGLNGFQAESHENNYRRIFNNLRILAEKTDIKDDETTSSYLNRLIKASERRKKQIDDFRIKNINNKLTYEPQSKSDRIEIDEEMRQKILLEINDAINNDYESLKPLKEDATIIQIRNAWRKMCIGSHERFSDEINTMLINSLPRYNSSKKPQRTIEDPVFYNSTYANFNYKNEFKYEPVYRWLSFPNPETDHIEKLPRNGEVFESDRVLSCSMNKVYAEDEYNDENSHMNVKYIIHPKSEISNARVLGYNQEVLYSKGQKFRMLDKELVEYVTPDKDKSYFRWEVHIQEA